MTADHAHGNGKIKNPGPFQLRGEINFFLWALFIVGLIAFVILFKRNAQSAWTIFVMNHFYFLSLALGGLFFSAIHWLTGAMWSAPVRRVAESFTGYLPVVAVTAVILFFGLHHLYHWSHPEAVSHDALLKAKAGYLNIPFFVIRNIIAVAVWLFFAWKIVGNSLAQDSNSSFSINVKNRALAPAFLILFALTFTMVSFDQIMSLSPHWFSTIFGVYCFAGMLYSTYALTTLVTIYLKRKGYLEGVVNENHIHDLGKFMFAFTVFWAYIGFSQFMLIWYANLPEETVYYIPRFQGKWFYVSLFLLIGKFVLPFLVMLPRGAKRCEPHLIAVAVWMLMCQWVDVLWMVQPTFFKDGPNIGLFEILASLGFVGLFGIAVTRFLSKNNVLAIGDPRLSEAVHHHHQ